MITDLPSSLWPVTTRRIFLGIRSSPGVREFNDTVALAGVKVEVGSPKPRPLRNPGMNAFKLRRFHALVISVWRGIAIIAFAGSDC
jgi:hypothetical protein